MKHTIRDLSETGGSDVQGTTVGTKYGLQPIEFLREIVDAAKNRHYFAQAVRVITLPPKTHDVTIPKRSAYEGRSGMSFDTTERTAADITWTTMDNLASVIATPSLVLAGYAITQTAIRTNALNITQEAKEELTYALGDRVDYAIAQAIGDATSTTSSATGAQTIYGGDATAGSGLTAGDVLTTEIFANARELLMTVNKQYRASTGAGGGYGALTGTVTGNGWANSPDDPFIMYIGPAQEKAFLTDSQFTNAGEYGAREALLNGEIGKYLGVKIVVTNNVEQVASGSNCPDASAGAATVNMTRCIMTKAKKACALVWGRAPELKVWDYNERDQVRLSIVSEYAITLIQSDAIVFVDVAD